MQLLRRRKTEDRSYALHPALQEAWAEPLGLNLKTTQTADGSLQIADVFACVRCLADSAASVPLIAYRAGDSGRTRLASGRLPGLLDRPAPATTQSALVGTLMSHLALWGNGYVGKFRNEDGVIEQLGCLHPDQIEVELVAGMPRYTVTDPKSGRSPSTAWRT
jgi:phage portal protein BeeE